jgi:hypothetical protein
VKDAMMELYSITHAIIDAIIDIMMDSLVAAMVDVLGGAVDVTDAEKGCFFGHHDGRCDVSGHLEMSTEIGERMGESPHSKRYGAVYWDTL